MAFIPVPNGASLCFQFTTAGQNWQFCITVRKTAGAPSVSDLATLAAAGVSWWNATLKSLIYTATTLNQVVATDLTTQGGPQDIDVVGTPGTATGGIIPVGTPIVVSFRTALRGRSYRGRAYVTGTSSSNLVDSANVSSTITSGLGAAFATLGGTLSTAGMPHVVASKQHNGAVTNPAATNAVITYVVDGKLDSQRRRLAGRGT